MPDTGGGTAPSFFPSIALAAGSAQSPPFTVVIDTNTVMALLVFEDPMLARLRQLVDTGVLHPAARADALEELRLVLAYRQFNLSAERQHELLACYRNACDTVAPATADARPLPTCRDPDDQKFLESARDAGAALLITRDKALLRLDRHRLIRPHYRIVRPEAFNLENRS